MHVQKAPATTRKARHYIELMGSAHWASTGQEYGNWAKSDPTVESNHVIDLHAAAHIAKYGYAKVQTRPSRSVSEARLAEPLAPVPAAPTSPPGAAPGSVRSAAAESEEGGEAARRELVRPPRAHFQNMMGPGDNSPEQGFPGAPGGSRGMRSGSQPLWSFERNPSLVHPRLEQDRGRMGRGVAGPAPKTVSLQVGQVDTDRAPFRARNEFQGPIGTATPALRRSRSEASQVPKRTFSGLEGVIGTQWDGAAVTAGAALRGSDGKYLGY